MGVLSRTQHLCLRSNGTQASRRTHIIHFVLSQIRRFASPLMYFHLRTLRLLHSTIEHERILPPPLPGKNAFFICFFLCLNMDLVSLDCNLCFNVIFHLLSTVRHIYCMVFQIAHYNTKGPPLDFPPDFILARGVSFNPSSHSTPALHALKGRAC